MPEGNPEGYKTKPGSFESMLSPEQLERFEGSDDYFSDVYHGKGHGTGDVFNDEEYDDAFWHYVMTGELPRDADESKEFQADSLRDAARKLMPDESSVFADLLKSIPFREGVPDFKDVYSGTERKGPDIRPMDQKQRDVRKVKAENDAKMADIRADQAGGVRADQMRDSGLDMPISQRRIDQILGSEPGSMQFSRDDVLSLLQEMEEQGAASLSLDEFIDVVMGPVEQSDGAISPEEVIHRYFLRYYGPDFKRVTDPGQTGMERGVPVSKEMREELADEFGEDEVQYDYDNPFSEEEEERVSEEFEQAWQEGLKQGLDPESAEFWQWMIDRQDYLTRRSDKIGFQQAPRAPDVKPPRKKKPGFTESKAQRAGRKEADRLKQLEGNR